jgi:hypothetical protein
MRSACGSGRSFAEAALAALAALAESDESAGGRGGVPWAAAAAFGSRSGFTGAEEAVANAGAAAGAPFSVTVIDAAPSEVRLRGALRDKRTLDVPTISRKTAAIAVCGRIAHRPARDRICANPSSTFFSPSAACTARRSRLSKPSLGASTGNVTSFRVARSPAMSDEQRAQPPTCRFDAARVSSSSSP